MQIWDKLKPQVWKKRDNEANWEDFVVGVVAGSQARHMCLQRKSSLVDNQRGLHNHGSTFSWKSLSTEVWKIR